MASGLPSAHAVRFLPRIPQDQVLTYLALSSLGVISYEESPLTEVAIPTKVFEYAAAGKPMAIARLRALVGLFGDAAEFFQAGNERDLALAIERILTDPARAKHLVDKARDVLASCSWEIMQRRLLSAYAPPPPPAARRPRNSSSLQASLPLAPAPRARAPTGS